MMNRYSCLTALQKLRLPNTVVVTTMGSAAPWSHLSNSNLDFPSVGSAMGHAADFAMGIALAQPERKIWVLNGDGSMLMSLGTLVTVAQTPPPNLVIYVIQNNTYEVTGNQLIPGGDRLSMTTLAKGAGILHAYQIDSVKGMNETLPEILDQEGPIFINLLVETGQEPPPALDRPLKLVSSEFRDTLTRASKKR